MSIPEMMILAYLILFGTVSIGILLQRAKSTVPRLPDKVGSFLMKMSPVVLGSYIVWEELFSLKAVILMAGFTVMCIGLFYKLKRDERLKRESVNE